MSHQYLLHNVDSSIIFEAEDSEDSEDSIDSMSAAGADVQGAAVGLMDEEIAQQHVDQNEEVLGDALETDANDEVSRKRERVEARGPLDPSAAQRDAASTPSR